jgi:hypothetical protein
MTVAPAPAFFSYHALIELLIAPNEPKEKMSMAWGSAQPLEKSRSGKGIQAFSFGCLWRDVAGFG